MDTQSLLHAAKEYIKAAPPYAQLRTSGRGADLLCFRGDLCPSGASCQYQPLCLHAHAPNQRLKGKTSDHVTAALRTVQILSQGCVDCGTADKLVFDFKKDMERWICRSCSD